MFFPAVSVCCYRARTERGKKKEEGSNGNVSLHVETSKTQTKRLLSRNVIFEARHVSFTGRPARLRRIHHPILHNERRIVSWIGSVVPTPFGGRFLTLDSIVRIYPNLRNYGLTHLGIYAFSSDFMVLSSIIIIYIVHFCD